MSNLQSGQTPNESMPRDDRRGDRHRDPFGRAMGGLVLILLVVIFFMVQSGLFILTWTNMWGAFLMGLGALLILQALLRVFFSAYRRGVFGLIIGGCVLIALGTLPFGGMIWAQWWPLGLIALGVVLLIEQFVRW